jgi:type IV pilus assembly protein PilQ
MRHTRWSVGAWAIGFWMAAGALAGMAPAQTNEAVPATVETEGGTVVIPPPLAAFTDKVTINVEGGSLIQVLNAFSRQTGKSLVIGPAVTATVNVRINEVPWTEALDLILRPYGFGYRQVGDTIVVNKLQDMTAQVAEDPLVSRVFNLKYLDAAGVKEIVESQLTARGRWSALMARGQRGWSELAGYGGVAGGGGGQLGGLDRRQRAAEEDEKEIALHKLRSKTIIVTDTAVAVDSIAKMLAEVDRIPPQVLIEARFVEVTANFLRDLGVEFGTGHNGTGSDQVQPANVANRGELYGVGARQTGGNVTPAAFAPASKDLAATKPSNGGVSLLFQQLSGMQFDVLMHLLEEKDGGKLLSSPRVLTLNDQQATIMVGTQYPIVQSQVSGSGGGNTTSTSVQFWANIGIQLNVIPQICDSELIRMIVNPQVRRQVADVSGSVANADTGGGVSLTKYPVISTREAETQILVKSGGTVVIGGLLEDQEKKTRIGVPVLQSIPLLGWLFRRETTSTQKTDLLIFLTATIMTAEGQPVNVAEKEGAPAARLPVSVASLPDAPADPSRLAQEKTALEAARQQAAANAAGSGAIALPDAQKAVVARFPSVPAE